MLLVAFEPAENTLLVYYLMMICDFEQRFRLSLAAESSVSNSVFVIAIPRRLRECKRGIHGPRRRSCSFSPVRLVTFAIFSTAQSIDGRQNGWGNAYVPVM